MADDLERIAVARSDIARLKGEKEAFEQSNAPDDIDEEELIAWNYAKDLDRQARDLRAEHKDALKKLKKLEVACAKVRATTTDKIALAEARATLQTELAKLREIDAALIPYEQIKKSLAEARARYRQLTNAVVDELKARCEIMQPNQKQALVLELFAQDLHGTPDTALTETRQLLTHFVERVWDKYFSPLS